MPNVSETDLGKKLDAEFRDAGALGKLLMLSPIIAGLVLFALAVM